VAEAHPAARSPSGELEAGQDLDGLGVRAVDGGHVAHDHGGSALEDRSDPLPQPRDVLGRERSADDDVDRDERRS
jgi:hypothetical protein